MRKKTKIIYLSLMALYLSVLIGGCGQKEKVEIVEEPAEIAEVEEVEERAIPQHDEKLYVAVPIESMSMRTAPGFDAEIITQVYPQTLLKAAREAVTVNGLEFYYVSTLDESNEGYCAANYCIEISYESNDLLLTVVDTETALYTYDDMERDLKELAEKYPNYVSVDTIGESVEGRALYQAILGNKEAKRKILIQAGIHGR